MKTISDNTNGRGREGKKKRSEANEPADAPGWCRVIVKRLSKLEVNQARLKDQFYELAQELRYSSSKKKKNDLRREDRAEWIWGPTFTGNFDNAYGRVLQSLGHALLVSSISSGNIIFC
uniref:Uncharacterized protein n=1 Tax=Chenopodium quinoa TaxID=63459 RepID=A0A803LQQ5_CHEQI